MFLFLIICGGGVLLPLCLHENSAMRSIIIVKQILDGNATTTFLDIMNTSYFLPRSCSVDDLVHGFNNKLRPSFDNVAPK